MIKMNIICHNCNHEFEAQLREAFEMVKCPICKNEQMVQALGKRVQNTPESDPRYTTPAASRVVSPL